MMLATTGYGLATLDRTFAGLRVFLVEFGETSLSLLVPFRARKLWGCLHFGRLFWLVCPGEFERVEPLELRQAHHLVSMQQ